MSPLHFALTRQFDVGSFDQPRSCRVSGFKPDKPHRGAVVNQLENIIARITLDVKRLILHQHVVVMVLPCLAMRSYGQVGIQENRPTHLLVALPRTHKILKPL